jgi:hypothetical protein
LAQASLVLWTCLFLFFITKATILDRTRLKGGATGQVCGVQRLRGTKTSLAQLEIWCQQTQVSTRQRISPKIIYVLVTGTQKLSPALAWAEKVKKYQSDWTACVEPVVIPTKLLVVSVNILKSHLLTHFSFWPKKKKQDLNMYKREVRVSSCTRNSLYYPVFLCAPVCVHFKWLPSLMTCRAARYVSQRWHDSHFCTQFSLLF